MANSLMEVKDPWARHWLILPKKGWDEWLLRSWSKKSGIASRSQFVQLRSLVEMAASGADRLPFSSTKLHLTVASVVDQLRGQLPIPSKILPEEVDGKMIAWSRQLAEGLDLGALCREGFPHQSSELKALAGQSEVSKILDGHLGNISDDVFLASTKQWAESWENKGGVPHLWIGLDAGLPFHLMKKLRLMLEALPSSRVHLYLLSPAQCYWGDLTTGRRVFRTENDLEVHESAGPVMKFFGKRAQDLHNQAVEKWLAEGDGGEEIDSESPEGSLLWRLQERCRKPGEEEEASRVEPDGSFEVHACRSPLRELEVCRDRILQCMNDDDSLMPEDVLLLVAGSDRYAPLVSAALQPQHDKKIPFRLMTMVGSLSSSLAEGVLTLFETLRSRVEQEGLSNLMDHPLLSAQFGFGERASELFSWLQDAGYRWGLDEKHRKDEQDIVEDRWNLEYALKRLAFGATVAPEFMDGVVKGQAPLNRASGLGVSEIAKLSFFGKKLVWAKDELKDDQTLTIGDWRRRTEELIKTFFAEGDADQQQERAGILNSILPDLEKQSPRNLKMTFTAFLRLFREKCQTTSPHRGGRGGGVTVAPLDQYAGTPAKVILVAGLGGGHFPSRVDRPTWHPLTTTQDQPRKWGDPDSRDDDRHLILLTLLSAKEKLIMTYEGGSYEDDKERPPSTPLADLIDAAKACCFQGEGKTFHFTKALLNGFSPAAHESQNESQRSFLLSDLKGAEVLLGSNSEPYPGLWSENLLEEKEKSSVTRRELKYLIKEPARIFLLRLGIWPPEQEEALASGELLELDALQAYSITQRMIDARLKDGYAEELFRIRLERSGELPPGAYGAKVWDKNVELIPGIENGSWSRTDLKGEVDIDVTKKGTRNLALGLDLAWYQKGEDGVFIHWPHKGWAIEGSKKRMDKLFQVQIDLLMLAVARGSVIAKVLGRVEKKPTGVMPVEHTFSCNDSSSAIELLRELTKLLDIAKKVPLPMTDQLYTKMLSKSEGKGVNDQDILDEASEKWFDAGYNSPVPSASENPVHRIAFRGLDSPPLWAGPKGLDLKPLESTASITLSVFEKLRKWQSDCEEVILRVKEVR